MYAFNVILRKVIKQKMTKKSVIHGLHDKSLSIDE